MKELEILNSFKNKYKNILEIKYIVGSFARGDFNQNSDIDIIYSLNPDFLANRDVFEIFNILAEMKEELQKKLKRKIDLIDESSRNNIAKKYMKGKIYV